jgi:sialate O-acetylesterase
MQIRVLFTAFFVLTQLFVMAQAKEAWGKKKCAVSLTYDDALQVHLDHVVPALDSLGLKATFYLSGYSPAFTNRIAQWKGVAAQGHELGNHTLFHPCAGKPPGRGFVVPEYDLDTYTVKRMADEIKMTNALLYSLDGKTRRTFAYPCGDTQVNGVSYYDQVKNDFVAARGVNPEWIKINNLNPANIGCYVVNGQTGDQLIAQVKKAMDTNTLIVFLFHGVGGGHGLNVSLSAHHQLLQFLKQQEQHVWVAPLQEIADYAQAKNQQAKTSQPKK